MLSIPGRGCMTCEGPTRRELLRAGSIGMLGLNLANFFGWQKAQGSCRLPISWREAEASRAPSR